MDEFRDEISWLSGARPAADADRLDEIERAVLERVARRKRTQTLLAGSAVSGLLACGFVVAALVGAGPINEGNDPARAKDDCRTVTSPTVIDEGAIVADQRGTPTVVTETRTVQLGVTTCR